MSDADLFEEIVAAFMRGSETRAVVTDLDHEWFQAHPEHSRRIRKMVAGEFDSESGGFFGESADFVVLVQRGGVRILFPLGSFDERGWNAGGLG